MVLSWEITQQNVLDTLHRAGGSLESRLLVGHFMAGIKDERLVNPKSLRELSGILNRVAIVTDTHGDKPVWKLKKEFV